MPKDLRLLIDRRPTDFRPTDFLPTDFRLPALLSLAAEENLEALIDFFDFRPFLPPTPPTLFRTVPVFILCCGRNDARPESFVPRALNPELLVGESSSPQYSAFQKESPVVGQTF